MVILMLVLGLVVLTVRAELPVRGSSRLAMAMGVSPLVVGLTLRSEMLWAAIFSMCCSSLVCRP